MRRLWDLVAIGFRASPGLSAGVWILGALGAIASVCYTIGFRITIDAATAHDAHRIAFGVILIAFGFKLPPWRVAMLGFSAGVLDLIASYFYYWALKSGEASEELAAMGGFGPVATALIAALMRRSHRHHACPCW